MLILGRKAANLKLSGLNLMVVLEIKISQG